MTPLSVLSIWFLIVSIQATTLTNILSQTSPLTANLLDYLHDTSTSISSIALASSPSSHFYLLATIQLFDTNESPPLIIDHPDDDLRSDNDDLLLVRLSRSASPLWALRMGTPVRDVPTALAVDVSGDAYVSLYTSASFAQQDPGSLVVKVDVTGERLWIRSYSSSSSTYRINALCFHPTFRNVLLAAGSSTQSGDDIDSDISTTTSTSAVAFAIHAKTGVLNGVQQATMRSADNSTIFPSFGNAAVAGTINGSAALFVVGETTVSESGRSNAAIFSFTLTNLMTASVNYVPSVRREKLVSVARSLNEHSIYCIGTVYISSYEEHDVRVMRANSSDLMTGWSKLMGSVRFSSSASRRNGQAEEIAQQVIVDQFGNVHVLLDSTSRLKALDVVLADEEADVDTLTNKRPGIVTWSANGSIVHVAQSRVTHAVTSAGMAIVDEAILVAGTTVNATTGLSQVFLTGLLRSGALNESHAEELVPENVVHAGSLASLFGNVPLWIKAIASVAGVCMFVFVCLMSWSAIQRHVQQARLLGNQRTQC